MRTVLESRTTALQMLQDSALKTQLIEEVKFLLEEQGGGTNQLLFSASHLAQVCGDVWHEELFMLHVEGLDVDESAPNLTTLPDLAPDISDAFYKDRTLSTGRHDSRPLKQLELWCRDLPAFAESSKAKEYPAVADEIPQLVAELSAIISRIKDRVRHFVERIEAADALARSPDSHLGGTSVPAHPPAAGSAEAGPLTAAGGVSSDVTKPTLTLIMKGGGIKGLAYVGALRELTKYYDFNWYAGTSAGAITAALLAAGVDVDELEAVLRKTNFKKVLFDAPKRSLLINLLTKGGLYPGVKFQAWIGNLINETLHHPVTVHLNDLPKYPSLLKHRLTVYASTKNKRTLVFDSNSEVSSGTAVYFAVRCSMSIPFLFIAESNAGAKTVDGGVQNNYPVDALLKDNPGVDFIGLYLGPEVYEEEERRPSPLVAAVRDLFSLLLNEDEEVLRAHVDRTIVIDPRPVSTLDFNLSDEEKEFLLKAGRASALRFIYGKSMPNGPTAEDIVKAADEARLAREVVINLRTKRGRYWRIVRTKWPLLLLLLLLFLGVGAAAVIFWLRW
jgi:predicted acylesterase/phospholipase RssA